MSNFNYDNSTRNWEKLANKQLYESMYPNYTLIQKKFTKPIYRVYEHKNISSEIFGLKGWLDFHETHDENGDIKSE